MSYGILTRIRRFLTGLRVLGRILLPLKRACSAVGSARQSH